MKGSAETRIEKDTAIMEEDREEDYLEENQEGDATLQSSFTKPPLKKMKIDESDVECSCEKLNKPLETAEADVEMEEFEDSQEEYERRGFTRSGRVMTPCIGGIIYPLDMANLDGENAILFPGRIHYDISEENGEKGTNLKLDCIIKANYGGGTPVVRYYATFDAIDSCGILKTHQTVVYYDAYFSPDKVEVVEFRKKPLNIIDGSKDLSAGIIGESCLE